MGIGRICRPKGYIAGDILAMPAGFSTMKSEYPQSPYCYDPEVRYVFTKDPYESPLTANHAGPLCQQKMKEKGPAYARWAKVYNIKQMSKTLLFLREHDIQNLDQLSSLASEKSRIRDDLLSSIRSSETRLAEIATLKKYIINYSKTRNTYEECKQLSAVKREKNTRIRCHFWRC